MENKKFLYVDQDDNSMYEVEINNDPFNRTITLGYAEQDDKWTSLCKGKDALILEDTGDGIIIQDGLNPTRRITLSYSDVAHFIMVFRALNLDTDWGSIASSIARYEIKDD